MGSLPGARMAWLAFVVGHAIAPAACSAPPDEVLHGDGGPPARAPVAADFALYGRSGMVLGRAARIAADARGGDVGVARGLGNAALADLTLGSDAELPADRAVFAASVQIGANARLGVLRADTVDVSAGASF